MAGKREKPSVLRRLKNYFAKPGMFSRVLVIGCLAYCVRICEWAMRQFELLNSEASTLLSASLALFGGELLLLCLKRVFAKKDNQTAAESEEDHQDFAC